MLIYNFLPLTIDIILPLHLYHPLEVISVDLSDLSFYDITMFSEKQVENPNFDQFWQYQSFPDLNFYHFKKCFGGKHNYIKCITGSANSFC